MTCEQTKKAAKLSNRIIHLAQNTLLLNLRFMDSAIFRLSPKAAETTLATDGRYIYYGTEYILKRYKSEQNQVVRDVLHVILHCIFRHSFVGSSIDIPIWNLAADIAVEEIIRSLNIQNVFTNNAKAQEKILDDLRGSMKTLSAEHIYRYYKDKGIDYLQAEKIRTLFISDDHSNWYNPEEQFRLSGQQSNNSSSQKQNGSSRQKDAPSGDNSSQADENDTATSPSLETSKEELEKEWESVSRRIQMDMETFSKDRGSQAGNMIQQLRELNRERYNYDVFLKKFAVMGEAMQINDDEFDYIFYTYGLKLFGNVPLIEPLEYKDVKRVREFVVAIDTSGSTSGELVQRFLEKTYNILKNTESFFSKINLHIIQCDAAIQEHIKITNQAEFDDYIKGLTIKGLGWTDFRPVFTLVDDLIAQGEFTHLKGMIYFTDGYGVFPSQKPTYETAFAFIRNEYDNPEVPPWAIKLVLNNEDI